MAEWECPTNLREASGLAPEAVHEEVEEFEVSDEYYQAVKERANMDIDDITLTRPDGVVLDFTDDNHGAGL